MYDDIIHYVTKDYIIETTELYKNGSTPLYLAYRLSYKKIVEIFNLNMTK